MVFQTDKQIKIPCAFDLFRLQPRVCLEGGGHVHRPTAAASDSYEGISIENALGRS